MSAKSRAAAQHDRFEPSGCTSAQDLGPARRIFVSYQSHAARDLRQRIHVGCATPLGAADLAAMTRVRGARCDVNRYCGRQMEADDPDGILRA
jgi:hypothetical protein